jgi:alkanesulfonate monooxygenase SsuD/methylene tetrahydromethanopterin reductase-like flavin-dependent oxidoreductase (luciferase family)
VLPGLLPILGATEREALEKEQMLNDLLHPAVGIWMLSEQMNFRLYEYPQDAPLPTADIRAAGSGFTPRVISLMDRADREALSIRECGTLVAASRSHGSFVGTPEQLVDHMELWLNDGACDGFNIMPAYFQDELDLFVDQVVPLLQRKGLFRTDYTGTTLRDNLGLRHPPRR